MKNNFLKGHIPWNKGLTKETDERVRVGSERVLPKLLKRIKLMERCRYCGQILKKGGNSKSHSHINSFLDSSQQKKYSNKLWSKYTNEEIHSWLLKGSRQKPTNLENILIEIIKKENFPFSYVGNGQIFINGFNPDFINNNSQKKIIEVNGNYWHTLPESKKRDSRKIETYKKYGYDTLIIWEDELKDSSSIVEKIKHFLIQGAIG